MGLVQEDRRPACCRNEENLREVARAKNPHGTLITRRCQECGRRHFEANATPKVVGVHPGR